MRYDTKYDGIQCDIMRCNTMGYINDVFYSNNHEIQKRDTKLTESEKYLMSIMDFYLFCLYVSIIDRVGVN